MPIYLDYNATAPLRQQVIDIMTEISKLPANPSSAHQFGRRAKKYVEDARRMVAQAISVWSDEVIFTASATEANNMVLKAFASQAISAVEHSSVLKAARDPQLIAVDNEGMVDLAALEAQLAKHQPKLVSVMLANNETGVIQPVTEIAALCKKHNVLLHCDAVQGLGKIPVDCGALGADLITLTTHKCGGPVGAGILVIRRGIDVAPLLAGGGQEMRKRAGTENVAAIAGAAKAIELVDLNQVKVWRQWLSTMEQAFIQRGALVLGTGASRLPNTSCVVMPGISQETQLMDFDLAGFAVSAGSACSSGRIEPSHVLLAMGIDKKLAGSAIRVSLGWDTKEEEIHAFTQAWIATCERLAKIA
ncbi:MAG: cysteine desulfurase family protein [Rickettsiales bacterium]|nr:cysteine desulfurase family protein [Rickettsiales bacterium]